MPRRTAKVYSRFDVGTYMQEKKRLRKETTLAHKTLAKKKSKLDRLIYRVNTYSFVFYNAVLGGHKQRYFAVLLKAFTSMYMA